MFMCLLVLITVRTDPAVVYTVGIFLPSFWLRPALLGSGLHNVGGGLHPLRRGGRHVKKRYRLRL